jgi:hypothetical protein
MDARMVRSASFSLESIAVLAKAARLADDDASGSVPEASDGATNPTVVSAAHLWSALDTATTGDLPDPRVSGEARSTALVQRILVAATEASAQAGADEVTPEHLRAGLDAVLQALNIAPEGLRRARGRAVALAPSNLGVTSLRHRDVPALATTRRSLTT